MDLVGIVQCDFCLANATDAVEDDGPGGVLGGGARAKGPVDALQDVLSSSKEMIPRPKEVLIEHGRIKARRGNRERRQSCCTGIMNKEGEDEDGGQPWQALSCLSASR
jgi:hypothetical protein